MIERVILLRCRDRSPAAVAEVAQAVLALLEGRPEVAGAAVDHPADAATASTWDLRVTVALADVATLETYAQDPVHARFVETWLAPRTEAREAWTFHRSCDRTCTLAGQQARKGPSAAGAPELLG